MSRTIMLQGTGSNVGKSMLVAGLCRAFAARGLRVRPFKPQNMSNNAAVTVDGGEIGRAQAVQARACGADPTVDMNPVLLKPETESGAQVVVQGRRRATVAAGDYARLRPELMTPVLESLSRLRREADLVIVEGAGSPAEINLRRADIANMGLAEAAEVPVVLVGDIDRGGVIAQIVGTQAVMEPADAGRVAGFMVNKFRGDPALFEDGYAAIAARTGWPGLGVVPWFAEAGRLPAEDALDIAGGSGDGPVHVACPVLSRIANFDDLDPLKTAPGVRLSMVRPGEALPGDADLVILPGTKSTRGDLAFLRAQGWDVDLHAHVRRGGRVLGLCGGYQMLGQQVIDRDGLEGAPGADAGLGLLDVETEMAPEKRLARREAVHAGSGAAISGYEIHIGRTDGPDRARPFAHVGDRPEGAVAPGGRVAGSYLHGLFAGDGFRAAYLAELGAPAAGAPYEAGVEAVLDRLGAHMEAHAALDRLLSLAR